MSFHTFYSSPLYLTISTHISLLSKTSYHQSTIRRRTRNGGQKRTTTAMTMNDVVEGERTRTGRRDEKKNIHIHGDRVVSSEWARGFVGPRGGVRTMNERVNEYNLRQQPSTPRHPLVRTPFPFADRFIPLRPYSPDPSSLYWNVCSAAFYDRPQASHYDICSCFHLVALRKTMFPMVFYSSLWLLRAGWRFN